VISEKPEWISKVENLLTIKQQQVAELRRFCEKFGVKTIKMADGQELTPEQTVEKWQYYLATNAGKLNITPISNKPFLAITLTVKIHGRNIRIHNGQPEGEHYSCSSDEFSDESWEIADAIAQVFKGEIKTLRQYIEDSGEPYADTLTVVLDSGDYFEIAYNRL